MRKRTNLFLILMLLVASTAFSQTVKEESDKQTRKNKTDKQFINPAEMPKSPGYSQAVSVSNSGRTVYLSGQVAFNSKGEMIGKGDLRAQTEQVFENIKTVLAASGATFANVVKLSFYVKNYKPELVATIREVRNRYLSADRPPPASTLVGVQSLFQDEVLIEVEAVAVIP